MRKTTESYSDYSFLVRYIDITSLLDVDERYQALLQWRKEVKHRVESQANLD